jgi:serine-type D-Ala-D-Ala carboxypeptidase/endopeptidase (penicillin-binding protein 4)
MAKLIGRLMGRSCLSWGAMLLLVPSVAAQSPPPSAICPAQLSDRIEQVINQPGFARARWGIFVQTRKAQPQTLYDRDAESFFLPASNVKLFTTAAALTKLGSTTRIRTTIVGQAVNGQWHLRLIGAGDPSFSDVQIKSLAQQLKRQGIERISQFILDDRGFTGEPVNPTWEWGDLQESYGPIVNSLIINQNAIQVTLTPNRLGQPLTIQWTNPAELNGWTVENHTKTVATSAPEFTTISRDINQPLLRVSGQLKVGAAAETIDIAAPDPMLVWRDRLQTIFSTEQITLPAITVLSPMTATIAPNPRDREVAFIESPPIRDLIYETNQESNNLYAEVLLKQLASKQLTNKPVAGESATDAGIKILQTSLSQLQVNPDGYHLTDGSGLSRMNLVSPAAIVQLLQAMNNSPQAPDYRRSLPVAGRSGSLTQRFRNTPAAGILQAKTGTITNVVALSGYIAPPQYEPLVFSILLNQSTLPTPEQRRSVDAIALLLTQLRRCSS